MIKRITGTIITLFILSAVNFSTILGQNHDISRWERTFETTADYPTDWRYNTEEYAIDVEGKLRLDGKATAPPPSGVRATVASTIPYNTCMRWRGSLELDVTPTRANNVYILLYCYQTTPEVKYVCLRFGGPDKSPALVTAGVTAPSSTERLQLQEEEILLRVESLPLDAPVSFSYDVLMEKGKGWLLRLKSRSAYFSDTYVGASPFDKQVNNTRGGFSLVTKYTKTYRRHVAFDNLIVEASNYPIIPFNPDSPDEEDPIVVPTDTIPKLIPTETTSLPQVVINEMMAHPSPSESEWIELYNPSNHAISLSRLGVALMSDGGYRNYKALKTPFVLPPKGYVVLANSASSVNQRFPEVPRDSIVQLSLPQLPNKGFTLLLLTNEKAARGIDSAVYDTSSFEKGIRSKPGYSLERRSYKHSGLNPINWYSPANGQFATPGRANSRAEEIDSEDGESTPPLLPIDEATDRGKRRHNISRQELGRITLRHLSMEGNKCKGFLHTIQGQLVASLDHDAMADLAREITRTKAFDFKQHFNLAGENVYIFLVEMESHEAGFSRVYSIFRTRH